MGQGQDVIIVGAGLAGLCCARALQAAGVPWTLVEADAAVGGRVQTDTVDGFLLDRGFQVLLTGYPEAKRVLDYAALDLRPFYPGSIVQRAGRAHRIADPFRRPHHALASLLDAPGTLGDKLRILRLRHRAIRRLASDDDRTISDRLDLEGFSPPFREAFLDPWLRGIFSDPQLATSGRMLEFVFRFFAIGDAALPSAGMAAIPRQIAAALPTERIWVGRPARAIAEGQVQLADGEILQGRAVVVATSGPVAADLIPDLPAPASRSVTCLYFEAPRDPVGRPVLVLDGDGGRRGPINHLCVPSTVAPSYAPAGSSLVAATVVGPDAPDEATLQKAVREQLIGWFGSAVSSWRHLRTYRIPHALPAQPPRGSVRGRVDWGRGLYVCGDHRDTASIQGAMGSGRRAAAAVLDGLGVVAAA